jgi:hypothetical protein
MKRLAIFSVALVAALFHYPLPGSAAESAPTEQAEPAPAKDECLLYLVQCDLRVHSIQDKIEKLNEEIAKGKKVYNPEELRLLQEKLREANRILNMLLDQ